MKIIVVLIVLTGCAMPAYAADIENGDELHFEHCTGCHDSVVYTRENRNVHTYQRLGTQVRFCKDSLGLTWFDDEVEDVIEFLNRKYYHFEN
ncbi:MAG: cytochrome c [Gammaproteobacteria bacterium]|nr:cytochrome c [Gammaproteobacteria bacterium]MDH3447723.1 cytochrome c [Gammaproteobacteria bacterium]